MEIKKARVSPDGKPGKISIEHIEKELVNKAQTIIYLDKENNAKDIKKFCEYFTKTGHSVHCHEIFYGLDEDDYIYEMHIITPSLTQRQ